MSAVDEVDPIYFALIRAQEAEVERDAALAEVERLRAVLLDVWRLSRHRVQLSNRGTVVQLDDLVALLDDAGLTYEVLIPHSAAVPTEPASVQGSAKLPQNAAAGVPEPKEEAQR